VRVITITMETATLVVTGTASGRGGDILEGSLQLKVENSEATWSLYDGADISHDCKFSMKRLSMRHNIHSQAKASPPWYDVLIWSYLRRPSVAFCCKVESYRSQSKSLIPRIPLFYLFPFTDTTLFLSNYRWSR
jgi:hypothetical protein